MVLFYRKHLHELRKHRALRERRDRSDSDGKDQCIMSDLHENDRSEVRMSIQHDKMRGKDVMKM